MEHRVSFIPTTGSQMKSLNSNVAATKIQRWFRKVQVQKSRNYELSAISRLLESKKKNITERLKASRRLRESKELSPFSKISRSNSVSSYKEALLGNPVDMSVSPPSQATLSSDTTHCSQLSLHDVPDMVLDDGRQEQSHWSSLHSIKMDDLYPDVKDQDNRPDDTSEYQNEFLKSSPLRTSPQLIHIKENIGDPTYNELFKALEVLDDDNNYKDSDSMMKSMTSPTKESGYSSVEPIVMTVTSSEKETVANQRNDIIQFLNRADEDDYLALDPEKFNDMLNFKSPANGSQNTAEKMLSMNIEIEQKNKTIKTLIQALNQLKLEKREMLVSMKNDLETKLTKQKEEFENSVQKNLDFIDELLLDKKVLTSRCNQLNMELKHLKSENDDNFLTFEERYKAELKKATEEIAAAEKINRESWMKNKEEEIKALAMKNLEPDIQNLLSNHKIQIHHLNERHQEELKASENQLLKTHDAETRTLRENVIIAEETIKNLEKKMSKQVAGCDKGSNLELLRQELENSYGARIQMLNVSHENEIDELNKKHENEMIILKENVQEEKLAWEKSLLDEQVRAKLEAKYGLVLKLKKASDGIELDSMMNRIEQQTNVSLDRSDKSVTEKIRIIHYQYEAEVREQKKMYEDLNLKYMEAKRKITFLDSQLKVRNRTNDQNRNEMQRMNEVVRKYDKERKDLKQEIKQQFKAKITNLEIEKENFLEELTLTKKKCQEEVEQIKLKLHDYQQDKENELESIHQRIKVVVTKKDETIRQLNQQYFSAKKRADHLEEILDKQREELFLK